MAAGPAPKIECHASSYKGTNLYFQRAKIQWTRPTVNSEKSHGTRVTNQGLATLIKDQTPARGLTGPFLARSEEVAPTYYQSRLPAH